MKLIKFATNTTMYNKLIKLSILFLFVAIFISAAIWMYKKYVIPNSPYHTELKLRGAK
ncbi:MAG: hypothetical protein P8I11_03210 [Bacteroidia bacterium]|nr:hypothetical protein [Bacteroidia bacterium]